MLAAPTTELVPTPVIPIPYVPNPILEASMLDPIHTKALEKALQQNPVALIKAR
jgi:hypothetical protein